MESHPVGVVQWEVVGNNPGGSCPMGSRPGPCCIKLSYLTIILTTVWLTINRSYHRLIISVA